MRLTNWRGFKSWQSPKKPQFPSQTHLACDLTLPLYSESCHDATNQQLQWLPGCFRLWQNLIFLFFFIFTAPTCWDNLSPGWKWVRLDWTLHWVHRGVSPGPVCEKCCGVQRGSGLLLQRQVSNHGWPVQTIVGAQSRASRWCLLLAIQHGGYTLRELWNKQVHWRPEEMWKRVSIENEKLWKLTNLWNSTFFIYRHMMCGTLHCQNGSQKPRLPQSTYSTHTQTVNGQEVQCKVTR